MDLRDHAKVCGEQILCTCGSTFAFKCNLINHQKSKPECRAAAALQAQQGRGVWGRARGGAGGSTDGPKGPKKKGTGRKQLGGKVAAAPQWSDPSLDIPLLSPQLAEVKVMQGRTMAQGSMTAGDMTAGSLPFGNGSGTRVPIGAIPARGMPAGGMSVGAMFAGVGFGTSQGNRQGGASDGLAGMVRVEVLPAPVPPSGYGGGGWKGGQESKMRQCVPWARRGDLE